MASDFESEMLATMNAAPAQENTFEDDMLAGMATPPKLTDALDPETGSFEVDQWKMGIVDFFDQVLPDHAKLGIYGIDLGDYRTREGGIDAARLDDDIAAAKTQAAERFLGYKGIKPADDFDRFMAPGYRAMGDPLSLVGVQKGLVKTPLTLAAESLHTMAAAVLGRVSGEAASEALKDAGVESELAIETVAALTSGLSGVGVTAVRAPGAAAFKTTEGILAKRHTITGDADKAIEYIAASEIRRAIQEAETAQPDMAATINAVKTLENEVPGLVVPPMAALADNPVYRKNTEALLKTRPDFFAQARDSLSDASKALNDYKVRRFGVGGAQADKIIRDSLPKNYGVNMRSAEKRIAKLDDLIEKQVAKVEAGQDVVAVGSSVKNMMEARFKAVRAKYAPKYESTLKAAENSGISIAPKAAFRAVETIENLKTNDRFGNFPELSRELSSKWSTNWLASKKVQESGISVRELDSLKRATNKAIRKSTDAEKTRVLFALKEEVGKIYENSGEFGAAIKSLDEGFYKEFGVPASKEGIRQLSSSRFSAMAGSRLSSPEQAREFLSFVGEQGIPVLKDAILLRAADSGVIRADHSVNVDSLNKFVRKNGRLLSLVPGLKGQMADAGAAIRTIEDTRSRMQAEYTKYSKEQTDGFFKAFDNRSLYGVVGDILSNPGHSAKYYNDIKRFTPETKDMVVQAVRAQILENGMNSGQPMTRFLSEKRQAVDLWFGPRYVDSVETIARVSDVLSKIDVDNMRFAIDFSALDALEKRIGVSMAQSQSLLRDRITNVGTKAAIFGSKVSVAQGAKRKDNALMELLLNPNSLEGIRKSAEGARLTKDKFNAKALTKILSILSGMTGKGVYFAMDAAGDEQKAPDTVQTYSHPIPLANP